STLLHPSRLQGLKAGLTYISAPRIDSNIIRSAHTHAITSWEGINHTLGELHLRSSKPDGIDSSYDMESSGGPRSLLRQTITPANRPIITQYLLDAERTVKQYQAEINRLKLAIMTLESKKNRLKERMTEYRSMLSPIHRMPNELLTQIFALACEGNILSPKSLPPIIALPQSCGRFREIILSTPSLWSSMTLSFTAWNQTVTRCLRLKKWVQMFTEWAGACPFDLALDLRDGTRPRCVAAHAIEHDCGKLQELAKS
ncbi:hypothetical protein WG66_011751, partial [Moniliophthora roreri]